MKNYLIYVDASVDIDLNFAKEKGLNFIPMNYTYDNVEGIIRGDETDEELEQFYALIKAGKMPTTSQIAPFIYEELFTPLMEKGISILYIALSSGLSSTYQSALTASKTLKENFPYCDLVVVDSLSAAASIGLLAETAIKNKENGLSIFDNATDLEEFKKHIFVKAVVDDLNYLKRGGRVSATTAFVGSILGIKPMLLVNDEGKLTVYDKKRGSKNAINAIIKDFEEQANLETKLPIYVLHTLNQEMAEYTKTLVQNLCPYAKVIIKMISPIIGCHTGPGIVAVLCQAK